MSWKPLVPEQLKAEAQSIHGKDTLDNPTGIALSGGGIRSATFNLGVLQALQKKELLDGFHYLSTVSGGGYIGGFWGAWRTRNRCETCPPGQCEKCVSFPRSEDPSLLHLRGFSNFLQPRTQLFAFETGRIITAGIVSIVPSLLATLAFMVAIWLLFLGISGMLMEMAHQEAAAMVLYLLLLAHLLVEEIWHLRTRETRVAGERWWLFAWIAIAISLSLGSWWYLNQLVPLPLELRLAPTGLETLGAVHWLAALMPAAMFVLPYGLLIVTRVAISRRSKEPLVVRRQRMNSLESAISRTQLFMFSAAILGIVWVCGQILAGSGPTAILSALGVSGTGGGIVYWAGRLLRPQPNKPTDGKIKSTLRSSTLQLVIYATLLCLGALSAALVAQIFATWGTSGLWTAFAAATLIVVATRFFEPTEVGFHSFYRQRLARAYLGAARSCPAPGCTPSSRCPNGCKDPTLGKATLESEGDDLLLTDLSPSRPLHLICCAANDLAGDSLTSFNRGAESAVLNRVGVQVGRDFCRWTPKEADGRDTESIPPPFLSSVMTASAAAFNSHMGSISTRLGQGATFLLTALNLRLGLWFPHPKHWRRRDLTQWVPEFVLELLGQSSIDASRVHLSDGAHFENLGLYELVRRRCRFIVVSDCGADPDYAFDDLSNAIRRIRTDLGVEIEIDPSPLRRLGDEKLARQAVVAGTIKYPPRPVSAAHPGPSQKDCACLAALQEGEEDLKPKSENGVLVLIKPTLVGNEPADVRQYASRNDAFPQETTADQFYDEAQWESYRRLGEHAMSTALSMVKGTVQMKVDPDAQRKADQDAGVEPVSEERRLRWILAQGGHHWGPSAAIEPGMRLDLEQRWAEIEAKLGEDPQATGLAQQVLAGATAKELSQERDDDETLFGRLQAVLQFVATTNIGAEDEGDGGARLSGPPRHVRDALYLMETTLRVFGLDGGRPSPETFGWMNRIGRWAMSDLFRAWWPWLSPTISRRLKQYLEREFRLPSVRKTKGTIRKVDKGQPGYAYERWALDRKKAAARYEQAVNAHRLGYFVALPGAREPLMVAFLAAVFESGRLCWNSEDLFLPQGLWATGFAESFADALCTYQIDELADVKNLETHFLDKPPGVIDIALYAGAGFQIDRQRAVFDRVAAADRKAERAQKKEEEKEAAKKAAKKAKEAAKKAKEAAKKAKKEKEEKEEKTSEGSAGIDSSPQTSSDSRSAQGGEGQDD